MRIPGICESTFPQERREAPVVIMSSRRRTCLFVRGCCEGVDTGIGFSISKGERVETVSEGQGTVSEKISFTFS